MSEQDKKNTRPESDSWAIRIEPEDEIFDIKNLQGRNYSHFRGFQAGFNRCNLKGASFSFSHLEQAQFWLADLTHVDFSYAHLEMANLRGSVLREANLDNAHLRGANFRNADLRGVRNLQQAIELETADFTDALLDALDKNYLAKINKTARSPWLRWL